jgi:hypothetical protein
MADWITGWLMVRDATAMPDRSSTIARNGSDDPAVAPTRTSTEFARQILLQHHRAVLGLLSRSARLSIFATPRDPAPPGFGEARKPIEVRPLPGQRRCREPVPCPGRGLDEELLVAADAGIRRRDRQSGVRFETARAGAAAKLASTVGSRAAMPRSVQALWSAGKSSGESPRGMIRRRSGGTR